MQHFFLFEENAFINFLYVLFVPNKTENFHFSSMNYLAAVGMQFPPNSAA